MDGGLLKKMGSFLETTKFRLETMKPKTYLKIFILILISIYVTRSILKNTGIKEEIAVPISVPIEEKSTLGLIKDQVAQTAAVPEQYRELDGLTNDFLKSLNTDKPDWALMNEIGTIYKTGSFPFLQPDDLTAICVFRCCGMCPCPHASSLAISRNMDTRLNPLDKADRAGDVIDPSYAHRVIKAADEYIRNAPDEIFVNNKTDMRITPTAVAPPNVNPYSTIGVQVTTPSPVNTRNIDRNNFSSLFNPNTNVRISPTPVQDPLTEIRELREPITVRVRVVDANPGIRARGIGGGAQNAHDNGMVAATKTNIKTLKDEFLGKCMSDEEVVEKAVGICRDVLHRSKSDKTIGYTQSQLADAHRVITSLAPIEYSETGISQVQILGNVLKKIDTLDKNVAENVKETLAKRLATGIEHGTPVCATGKISRCMSVLEGVVDNAQKGVSIDLVKNEIANLASKVRDDYMKKMGPEGLAAYESSSSVPQYAENMKKILKDEVRKQYVEKMNMSASVINPIVEPYADAF